ncbi:DUF4198 domain-containing protein [Oceanivirga miroungae]|uniref:Nickel transport complex, NikM subunit, transmembrane n=1 Tax=Oceanivirga miroungae TaxID=1130046 RepID=A0A6I8MEM3_9FUSO|nr:DUF4198 domain-containing protein [Oceanivirga miroungae]VWL85544.1 hypothetical protein OMES3154_00830 [Oceanivirga miroungae]
MKKLISIFCLLSTMSLAHFQMINTDNLNVENDTRSVDFDIVFTHPAERGHSMDIGKDMNGNIKDVVSFVVKKGDKEIEAKSKLVKSKFRDALSYKFTLDRKLGLRGSGIWSLIMVPSPYYEASEDIYIQQVTKVFLHKGELVDDDMWHTKQTKKGYPDIISYIDPTNIWVNQAFVGQVVDGDNKPVKNAEIEIEFRNYDIKDGDFSDVEKTNHSSAKIYADDNGMFTFIPTKEGQWGFAALGAGGEKTVDGKELSLDAVLWIQVEK